MTTRVQRRPVLGRWAAAALVVVVAGASAVSGVSAATGGVHDAPVVRTANGAVRGVATAGGYVFHGLP